MLAPALYLIPVALDPSGAPATLPPATLAVVHGLARFIVESERSARRFLKAVRHPRPLPEIELAVLDEHTRPEALEALLAPLRAGTAWGLVSEAGCPAVADPGAELVRRAHEAGVRVVPLVGPCSIVLALMASGMDGQRFAFHGYLPVERSARAAAIRRLEARAHEATQIFIETPYRNQALLEALLEHCRGDTFLCIAADLTLPGELVATRSVAAWRAAPPALGGRPAVFLLWRGAGARFSAAARRRARGAAR